MKVNKTILGFTVGIVVVTMSVVIFSHDDFDSANTQNQNNGVTIGAQVASDFNTNVRSLAARLKKSERKNTTLENKIIQIYSKIDNISKESSVSNRSTGNMEEANKKISLLKGELSSLKSDFQRSRNKTKGKYPIYSEEKDSFNPRDKKFIDIDELANDNDVEQVKGGSSQQQRMTKLHRRVLTSKSLLTSEKPKEKKIPYYTIPAGSDVQNATLLTALIGEVPLKGKLAQPLFPFSTIISRGDLMAANSIDLPREIVGMKVGGFAYGVGSFMDNISCVRAYATSMLFVFQDGTFKTIVDDNQQSSATLTSSNSIGYLSDQFGNPCIKGTYQTNAPQVLSALLGSGLIKGAGTAVAQWQQSTTYGNGSATQVPSGSFGKFMGGQALAEGSGLAAEWLKDRLGDSFDIVYVPSSIPVNYNGRVTYRPNRLMLHITKNIEIDKSSTSRRINYGKSNQARDYRF